MSQVPDAPLEPRATAGAALDRDRRRVGVARQLGARDRAIAASRRVSTASSIPINPKYDEVWGRPCLRRSRELPRGVDFVVFVVPARVVVRMIDECGARGVRSVMVVSSGFAEAGEEGAALQARAARSGAAHTGCPCSGRTSRDS